MRILVGKLTFTSWLGMMMIALAMSAGARGQGQIAAQVKTESGVVEGELTSDQRVVAFKGIPYAAAPLGDLRWKPPQAAVKWTGVRSAKEFGYHCVQSATYGDMEFHDSGPSEDCLTLNVWTPAGAKRGSLPVMVWIYGGGSITGATSEHRQDGQFLALRDVVVVSMNYRLGIWGFMAHPELTAESPHHASGNYGWMDIAAALEWVKKNVAGFGGDPANVTLFGESAGSQAVSAEMASPLAKGLFAKAIGESGSTFYRSGQGLKSREEREKIDGEFAQRAFGMTKLAELRRVSTEDLERAVRGRGAARFGGSVDGYFLPEPIDSIFAHGKQAHIPLLAGWNSDEQRGAVLGQKGKLTAATFGAQAEQEFGARAKEFLGVYKAGSDEEAFTSAGDYAGDRFITYSTWRWLEAQVQTGGKPVYRFYFELGSPGDKNHTVEMGAFHSDEIEYVFGALDSRPEMKVRPEDRKLSEQMGQYWTNFARSGDPNGPGLPKWAAYWPTEWQVMHLKTDPESRADEHRGRFVFLDSVWNSVGGKGAQ